MRQCHPHVFQASRVDAEYYYQDHDFVIGVCPTPAIGILTPYLSHGVRDEDTPTQADIDMWVEFMKKNDLGYGRRVIVHCEAGQNRSSIVAALAITVFFCSHDRPIEQVWDEVVARLHDEFIKCDPPHNWWPYDHWDKAVREWLRNGDFNA